MALDSLAKMPEDSAVKLVNWFPTPTDVALRRGSQMWAQNITGPVTTLMVWKGPTRQKLFAVGSGKIWDVTTQSFEQETLWDVFPGALAPATDWDTPTPEPVETLWDDAEIDNKVDTGVVSLDGWWQWINFSNSGGNWLIAVNGAQQRQVYDGSTWSTAPAITGVDSAKLINIFEHKRRIWFIEKDSTRAWYLDTDAIGGAATQFDLGPLMSAGGYLVAGGSWTIDGGFGPDDYAFFLTSEGQLIVYLGTNPSDANSWGIKGTFQVGRPLGRRCLTKVGADIAITCEDGVISLAKSLTLDRSSAQQAAITKNIQDAFNNAVRATGALRGWQMMSYPVGTMAIVNVPTSSASAVQYVMNTITGAWCQFQGMNAACWALMDGKAYFGTWDGQVGLSDSGVSDVGAISLSADIVTAFNYLKPQAQQKQMKMLRPVIQGDTTVAPAVDVSTDFSIRTPQGVLSPIIPNGPRWDFAIWDQAVWTEEVPQVRLEWTTVFGLGYTFAATMNLTVTPPLGRNDLIEGVDVRVVSFDTIYEPGALM